MDLKSSHQNLLTGTEFHLFSSYVRLSDCHNRIVGFLFPQKYHFQFNFLIRKDGIMQFFWQEIL